MTIFVPPYIFNLCCNTVFAKIYNNGSHPSFTVLREARASYTALPSRSLGMRIRIIFKVNLLAQQTSHERYLLYPKLQLGTQNPRSSGFANCGKPELPALHSQAGAWEPA